MLAVVRSLCVIHLKFESAVRLITATVSYTQKQASHMSHVVSTALCLIFGRSSGGDLLPLSTTLYSLFPPAMKTLEMQYKPGNPSFHKLYQGSMSSDPPKNLHLRCPHLTSPHLTSPQLTSPHLTSPHLTSPHLTSPHLTSPHLTSPHLTSPPPQQEESWLRA